MKTIELSIQGMSCAACVAHVEKALQGLPGVQSASVILLEQRATVVGDDTLEPNVLIAAVQRAGYNATDGEQDRMAHRQKLQQDIEQLRKRLVRSLFFFVPLFYLTMGHMVGLPIPHFLHGAWMGIVQLVLCLPILWLNRVYFTRGFAALWRRSPNMDSLIALGASAAVLYSMYALVMLFYFTANHNSEMITYYTMRLYFESAGTIITLITLGKYLENRSKGKTSRAVEALLDLSPKTVTRQTPEGQWETVAADKVQIGDIVLVRPGESVAVDGIVMEGQTALDMSALTGESIPVHCGVGDMVSAASMNQNGTISIRATRVGRDTTLSQIIELVRQASSSKVPLARLADKISGVFVPVVMGIAAVTLVAWLMAGAGFSFALNCCITVLVISCPCALGLATPVAIMVGTGKAASGGMLFQSGEALQTLGKVKVVVFDKTGTLTEGRAQVQDVILLDDMDEKQFLSIAGGIEQGSNHPLAQAVLRYCDSHGQNLSQVTDIQTVAGRGVVGRWNDKKVMAGNTAFLREAGIVVDPKATVYAKQGKTLLLFAIDDKMVGFLTVVDPIKQGAAAAIRHLKKMGIYTVLLSGDQYYSARAVGDTLQLDEVVAEVLPGDKAKQIEKLREMHGSVAMVGDGINDAPALVLADVGIAIGAGADIAIESAAVVLMQNDVMDVVNAMRLSRRVTTNIKQNLFWAFFYNCIGIPIASGLFYPLWGWTLHPMFAAAAMSISSVFVVSNALRLQWFQKIREGKTMKKILMIDGMACAHCAARVEQTLQSLGGAEIIVDLSKKTVTGIFPTSVSDAQICQAISDAGYTVIEIQ